MVKISCPQTEQDMDAFWIQTVSAEREEPASLKRQQA
jgi:hypothetical protein